MLLPMNSAAPTSRTTASATSAIKPGKVPLGLLQRVTNGEADELQSLDAIDPVRVTKQGLPQSIDAVRTCPVPPVTNENRRTDRADNARTGLRVHHGAAGDHTTDRNLAIHDVLHPSVFGDATLQPQTALSVTVGTPRSRSSRPAPRLRSLRPAHIATVSRRRAPPRPATEYYAGFLRPWRSMFRPPGTVSTALRN